MQSEYDDHQSDEENRQLAEDYTSPFRFVGPGWPTTDVDEVQSEHDDHQSDHDIQPNYEVYFAPDVVSLLRFS